MFGDLFQAEIVAYSQHSVSGDKEGVTDARGPILDMLAIRVPLTNMKVQRKKQALEESDLSTFGRVGIC